MIFVTVGSQLPFDRMIEAVDNVAAHFPEKEFIAQVFGMKYRPKHIKTLDFIPPAAFRGYVERSELVIAHAGTGTILSVGQLAKPQIVFPRLGHLRETRNDHQEATCRGLEPLGLQVAWDEAQLLEKMQLFVKGALPVLDRIAPHASAGLLGSIRSFIHSEAEATEASLGIAGR